MKVRSVKRYEVIFPQIVSAFAFMVHKPGCVDVAREVRQCAGTAVETDLDLSDPEWSIAQIDDEGLGYGWDDVKVYGCTRMAAGPSGVFEWRGNMYRINARDEHRTQIHVGDEVTDRDETFVVRSVTRGPEYNGTAKVLVEITRCDAMPTRVGMVHDFYDHALELTVTRIDAS